MNGYLSFLCLFYFINISLQKVLKNKLYNEPKAFCGSNEITVMFETDLPFSGNVYAKGFFHKDTCRVHGDGIGNTVNITIPINADCGMRRRRMVGQRRSFDSTATPKGIVFETTVVIMFHKLFLTKSDKAFHIECRYEQTNEIYTQKLEVSMLPPTDIPSVNDAGASSPKCKYEVLEGDENGPPLSFAAIGQPVYHRWTCETASSDMHCLTVHSCMVDDGQGVKQDLLDADGCPVDTVLLDTIDYKGDLEAGKDSFVFKFADKPTVFFSCQLRVEPKDMDTGMCIRTSDHCAASSSDGGSETTSESENSEDTTSSVSIEPDFPRPSTPRFKATTPTSMTDFTDTLQSDMPNLSENLSENEMTEGITETMPPETTTPMMTKRKKIKARRPPRKIENDEGPFPEFVGVQRDLGIRRKQPSPDAIEMDVSAGAVEVIDPPEISVADSDASIPRPNISIINQNLNYNKICISKPLFHNILIISCFILLFIFSVILFLFWHFSKIPSKQSSSSSSSSLGEGTPSSTSRISTPNSSSRTTIQAFNTETT